MAKLKWKRLTPLQKAKAEIAMMIAADKERQSLFEKIVERAQKAETAAREAEDRHRALDILAGDMASAVSTAAKALKKDAKARAITSHAAALHLESLALRSWQRRQEIRSMRVVRGEAMAVTNEHKA